MSGDCSLSIFRVFEKSKRSSKSDVTRERYIAIYNGFLFSISKLQSNRISCTFCYFLTLEYGLNIAISIEIAFSEIITCINDLETNIKLSQVMSCLFCFEIN